MSNTNLTVDWIGNEALMLAHEKASFIGTINREFDSSFRPGYGSTIRIRVPSQYTQSSGRVIDVQDGVEQSTFITVATQNHVAMRYNSQEMAQDLVNFRKLHLEPAMAQLVSYIDGVCLSTATMATYNMAGTPGNQISTLVVPGEARARLNQYLAPKGGGRRAQIDSITMGNIVNGVAGYFNPSNAISEQYREGLVARTSMADYYENERVTALTSPSSVSSWASTQTFTNGLRTILVSTTTWFTPPVGSLFTLGWTSSVNQGFRACHPETKQPYSHLQTFTVTAASAATSTYTFDPPIYISGPRQNVVKSDGTAFSGTGVEVTSLIRFQGAASATYSQPLMYHRDAFTFATAALPLMGDAISCVVKTYDGLSLRVWEASDIRNDEKLTRIDILWGFSAIRAQWAARMFGSAL